MSATDQLIADFLQAKTSGCQEPAVWMDLANRYAAIGANMNWYYCIRQAAGCSVSVETEAGNASK